MAEKILIMTTLFILLAYTVANVRVVFHREHLENAATGAFSVLVLIVAIQVIQLLAGHALACCDLIRPESTFYNPNMTGFWLLSVLAFFVYMGGSVGNWAQMLCALGLFFASPRSFIICAAVLTILVYKKSLAYFWGTLIGLCIVVNFLPQGVISQRLQITSDRILLTPVVLCEYVTGRKCFSETYRKLVIPETDTRRKLMSYGGYENIRGRMEEGGVSDNGYKSFHYLLGVFFWPWLVLMLYPLFMARNKVLRAYYASALISAFTINIWLLFPSFVFMGVAYGLSLRDDV